MPLVLGLIALVFLTACSSTPRTLRLAEQIPHFQADYVPTEGDSMAGPLAELEQRLTDWGIAIGDLPPTVGGVGLSSLPARQILLRPGLPVNARFEVLAHEAGHLLQPVTLGNHEVGQVFAELVGVGIQQYYGSTTAEEVAALYLAQFKHAFGAERYLRRDIDYAVKALTGQVPMPVLRNP